MKAGKGKANFTLEEAIKAWGERGWEGGSIGTLVLFL